jgi:hypothetical protein
MSASPLYAATIWLTTCPMMADTPHAMRGNKGYCSYPSDVSDEEWSICVNYLTLMKQDAPQREHSSRAVFSALRYTPSHASLSMVLERPGLKVLCGFPGANLVFLSTGMR